MKTFLVVLVATAVFGITFASYQEDMSQTLLKFQRVQKSQSLLNESIAIWRKLEEVCPGAETKGYNAFASFLRCREEWTDDTICSIFKNKFESCIAPVQKVLEDCLPQKTKKLPALAVKSIVSSNAYFCNLNGEHILELMNQCIYDRDSIKIVLRNAVLKQCVDKTKLKIEQGRDNPPSTSEVCSFFTDIRHCVQIYVTTACRNQITRDTWIGLYDSLVSPCNSLNEVDAVKEE